MPVATTAIRGPGGALTTIAKRKPMMEVNIPKNPAMIITFLSLSDRSSAVDGGVTSIATTNIRPTVLRAATIAKDRSSIRK